MREVSTTTNKQCLEDPNSDNITKAINIEYQFCRKNASDKLRLNIFSYSFSKIELHPSVYSYLFYLLKKSQLGSR